MVVAAAAAVHLTVVVHRKSSAYRNIRTSLTSAVSASEFQSKVIFDEIEKQLKEVCFFLIFLLTFT